MVEESLRFGITMPMYFDIMLKHSWRGFMEVVIRLS